MITVKLRGGCANQAMIYLMGLARAKQHNVKLQLDVTSFDQDQMRQYSLDLFAGVDEELVRGVPVTVYEDGLPYNPALLEMINESSCLNGYFQCERYWNDQISHLEVKRIFQPRQKITPKGNETLKLIEQAGDQSCFLTIRRTDYVLSSFHGLMSMEYYLEALKLIYDRTGKKPIVFVFSDDADWCQENFKIPYDTVIAGNFDRTTKTHIGREDEELWLMSKTKHAVCANSTYSWLGAYLSERPVQMGRQLIYPDDKIIVAPKKWFGETSKEDSRDIVPDRWVRL